MSKLHYFQRYDAKENWLTNSTLLLLSRLYHHNRVTFEKVINDLLEESNLSLDVGVNFSQQEKGKNSVLDGIISQSSFKIVIETKLGDTFSFDQLARHAESLVEYQGKRILLCLSTRRISNKLREDMIRMLKGERYQGIELASTTYELIINYIQESLSDYAEQMKEILEDYISICQQHNLLNREEKTLLAVSVSISINENIKNNIYYDPANRSHNIPFKYIGLYNFKSIVSVGKVNKIAYCDLVDGVLVPSNGEKLNLSDEEYHRIKDTIESTTYYDLKRGNKFFIVEKFIMTDFKKNSPSSLRGKRYFYLDEISGFDTNMSTEDIAGFLKGKVWY